MIKYSKLGEKQNVKGWGRVNVGGERTKRASTLVTELDSNDGRIVFEHTSGDNHGRRLSPSDIQKINTTLNRLNRGADPLGISCFAKDTKTNRTLLLNIRSFPVGCERNFTLTTESGRVGGEIIRVEGYEGFLLNSCVLTLGMKDVNYDELVLWSLLTYREMQNIFRRNPDRPTQRSYTSKMLNYRHVVDGRPMDYRGRSTLGMGWIRSIREVERMEGKSLLECLIDVINSNRR